MHHLIQVFEPYLHQYGYLAVFAALFLEDFGVPVPGETLLIAGSLLATKGEINIFVLLPIAWLAAVLGDNVGYAIGRYGGRALVLRFGRYLRLTHERLSYAEGFFNRRGAVIVIFARFFEILRQLNGIVAGITRMAWGRFVIYNAIGAALWVGFWSTLFFQVGKQGERIGILYKRYEPLMLAALALLGGGIVVFQVLRKRRKARDLREKADHAPGTE